MKVYAWIILALIVAGLLYGAVHIVRKANRAEAAETALETERKAHKADIAALEAARDHEIQIAKEASDGYQKDLARLESGRDKPLVLRVCKPARNPVPAQTGAPSRPDGSSQGHVGEEASEDIGAALLDYGIACEANMLQLDRLQQWVRSR